MRRFTCAEPTTAETARNPKYSEAFSRSVKVFHMSAQIIQFVPKPNRDRSVQDSTKGWTLQPDLTWKKNEIIPFGGAGIDGMTFTAPDSDPA
jgi:hypothetical protein